MKKSMQFMLMSLVLCIFMHCSMHAMQQTELRKKYPFKKVIMWGHKAHSHTHSYIHWAFFRAFQHLGYETYWLDNADNVSNIDFSDSLFITESQVDQRIPLRDDCRYILHNCDPKKYQDIIMNGNAIFLQVYTNEVPQRPVEKLDDCIYWQSDIKCMYMPWGTDLLPHEIDEVKEKIKRRGAQQKVAYFIGTIGDGTFGNRQQLLPFMKACQERSIQFKQATGKSLEDNIHLIQTSLMSPAIQGFWQCDTGYIPCRIFKNISYGGLGMTNSKTVYDLFKGKIVYNSNTYQLFFDAQKRLATYTLADQFELMDFVKEKHTYLNRIMHLFSCLEKVKPFEAHA